MFIDDIYVKGMLFAVTIRSPSASGGIKEIIAPALPDSYTLITAADIPGKNRLEDFDVPILAGEKVSYIGEPVALLVGPDISKLEDYAKAFVINIVSIEESIPPLTDAGAGASQTAPAGTDDPAAAGSDTKDSAPAAPETEDSDTEALDTIDSKSTVPAAAKNAESGKPFNKAPETAAAPAATTAERIIRRREYKTGDTESIFAAASSVVEGEYTTGIQDHWYSEPHGAVAHFSGEKLKIHTASQWLYHVKRSAGAVLKIDSSLVFIEQTRMDIHLDGKIWYPSLIACQAALAAFITRRPVKLMLTREEDFRFSTKRNSSKIRVRSALGEKGEVLATEISGSLDLGAGEVFADEIIDHSSLGSLGVYENGKVKLDIRAIASNIPPQGPFAGFGLSQGFFAVERHVSRVAEFLKEDPAEWRKRHAQIKANTLAIGAALKENPPVRELIDAAAGTSDYYRKWASYELLRRNRRSVPPRQSGERLRGIGIAAAYQGAGLLYSGSDRGAYSVELILEKDGSLEIKTSIPRTSAGEALIWKSMAEEILGLEKVHIKLHYEARDSGPYTLSRNITTLTRLVEKCCHTIRKQRFRDPLPITVRKTVRPEKIKPWNMEDKTADPLAFNRPGWAAAAVEIEIDHVSLQPVVRGVWLAVDGGKILSETRARRSLKAAVIHAMGWAAREHLEYVDGQIQRYMMHNYEIATPIEIPPIHIDFINSSAAPPKGIGDLPYSCVPAAYVQAISQAMDHTFTGIPIGTRDIWEASLAKKAEARETGREEEKAP